MDLFLVFAGAAAADEDDTRPISAALEGASLLGPLAGATVSVFSQHSLLLLGLSSLRLAVQCWSLSSPIDADLVCR